MNHENKSTTYTSIDKNSIKSPKIRFTKNAVRWISVITELHDKEVGVLGIVREDGEDTYVVDEIFYPKHQEMNHGTCEISPEGESQIAEWLISKGREDDIEKVKFWGHSHHTMGVGPSHQDEEQAIERMERNKGYFVRGIFNKDGKMSISFYDYRNRRRFDHVKWTTDADEEEAEIRKKVKEMMKDNVPETTSIVAVHHTGGRSWDRGYGNGYHDDDMYGDYPYQGVPYRGGNYNRNYGSNKKNGKGKGKGKGKMYSPVMRTMNKKELEELEKNWAGKGAEFPDVKEFDFERTGA